MKQVRDQSFKPELQVLPLYIQPRTETIASKTCLQKNKYSTVHMASLLSPLSFVLKTQFPILLCLKAFSQMIQ